MELLDLEKINKDFEKSLDKIKTKGYLHFDSKRSIKFLWNYIKNPNNIEKHTFYPLLHYIQITKKYKINKETGKREKTKPKNRDLYYASHRDRAIYQYYAYITNYYYNRYMEKRKINEVAIAYRNNYKKGQGSNIFFAKKVIDEIKKTESFIIVGDFKAFFDTLDHDYLKRQLCEIFDKERLDLDFYKVYKSVIQFAYCDLKNIKAIIYKKKKIAPKELLSSDRLCSSSEFRMWKNKYNIIKKALDRQNRGIAQGTSISAVFSNVYMIKFDEVIYKYISLYNGSYYRYSDDFIIILPKINVDLLKLNSIYGVVQKEIAKVKLEIECKKTQIYEYNNEKITNITNEILKENDNNLDKELNYLGFSFNGKRIKIRDRSISKYYKRMYKKIDSLLKQRKQGKKRSNKNIYMLYSIVGLIRKKKNNNLLNRKRGNFIGYVQRSKKIFNSSEFEDYVEDRHLYKIKKRLNKNK